MLLAVLTEEQRIFIVFDTEVHVDEGATGVEIDRETLDQIIQKGGAFGDWVYSEGGFTFDPPPPPEPPQNTATMPSGSIPGSVL